ncbi:MAG: hypothetical protein K2M12_03390, partial [Muribaculaceae bacterium]|nr:hypothetical protein [Muribaculaceae bacterium]
VVAFRRFEAKTAWLTQQWGSQGGLDEITYVEGQQDTPPQYFTVTGLRVSRPEPSTLCIERRGAKVRKVFVR